MISSTFNDVDGDTLSITSTMSDGSALPTWITYTNNNNLNVQYTATPTPALRNSYTIKLIANDG